MKMFLFLFTILLFSCSHPEIKKSKINEINFDKNLTFSDFKKHIINYGINSVYPDINN